MYSQYTSLVCHILDLRSLCAETQLGWQELATMLTLLSGHSMNRILVNLLDSFKRNTGSLCVSHVKHHDSDCCLPANFPVSLKTHVANVSRQSERNMNLQSRFDYTS